MNKREKEAQQVFLDNEKEVLKKLEENYQDALDEINSKIELLLARQDADMQHVIYQVQYQQSLKKQVEAILETLHSNEFETLSEYLTKSYEDGFIGTMYDLQGQGIPLIFPLEQEQIVNAIQHETNLSESLYASLGKDVKDLSKKIAGEISRGISTGAMYTEIARNIASWGRIPKNNAMRIARTEAHRIQCRASMDACEKAKSKGADVVKQWDAALDKRTRESHAQVDGEIRELDEPFSNGLMYPGDPDGSAAEVINCRCSLNQRARWALGNNYTKWTPEAPVFIDDDGTTQYTIIEAKNLKDFSKKYNQATERVRHDVQKMKAINKYGEEIKYNLEGMAPEAQRVLKEKIAKLSKEYNTALTEINYNNKLGKRGSKKNGDVDALTGRIMEIGDVEGTIEHEFFHTLDCSDRLKFGNEFDTNADFWKESKKLFSKYKKETSNNKLNRISEYSLTNVDEFMAEAFKAEKTGSSDAFGGVGVSSTYVKEAMEIVDKFFKKTPLENNGKSSTIESKIKMPKEKFNSYSLNPQKAPDKAKAFQDALGYNLNNSDELIDNIMEHIDKNKFVSKGDNGHGMRYEQIIELTGANGKKANVLTAWIDEGENKRLTSVYVTKKKVTK